MTISETLPELITTTNQIAEIRRRQRPWASASGPAQDFLVAAGEQLEHREVLAAFEVQIARLRDQRQGATALQHNSTLADLLEQEAEAILHFHRSILAEDNARSVGRSGDKEQKEPPRPLKKAIKMMDTFMGSLLDLFGDLMPTWAKTSVIVWREAAALVID
ncbi:hypothetical protein [Gordonia sihwensis]|uniref:hypothetical protein n=1 Tax=Gordonia sihwensis TaxID=173559 RepID=UPI0005EF4C03|nr:hypothetical protein [Gordonia sihwensis]KJR10489.1 hypothetical protein UG54_00355 [Gordonia sihwensis]